MTDSKCCVRTRAPEIGRATEREIVRVIVVVTAAEIVPARVTGLVAAIAQVPQIVQRAAAIELVQRAAAIEPAQRGVAIAQRPPTAAAPVTAQLRPIAAAAAIAAAP